MERSGRVVVVADSSKIDVTAFARISSLDAVQELITDGDAEADALAGIQSAGAFEYVGSSATTQREFL